MLAVWIILGLILLFILLLLLPLRIHLQYAPEQGLQYQVSYLFFIFADSSKPKESKATPQKKEQKPAKKDSNAVGKLLSLLGLDEISSAAKVKQALNSKGLVDTLQSVFAAVKSLFSRIFGLLRKGVFAKFDLHIAVGGEDAADTALTYGTVCAAVYPLLSLLDSGMKFRKRNVSIVCDYDRDKTTATFDGQLNYRLGSLAAFALDFLLRYIKQSSKEGKPS